MQQGMRNLSVFILGTTAVGKTKLSLELCKYLNGEIVSCDSKQLYKHANLMTAKSTPQELLAYKHNMIDCLQLQENSYNRNKYFQQVKTHTNRIWQSGKTPIFIGGTNYYLQPILYNVQDLGRIYEEKENSERKNQKVEEIQVKQQVKQKQHSELQGSNVDWLKNLTREQKYLKLKQVDPMMAQKLHKNDQTRINSFLQRFYKNNKKPSQSYKPYTTQLNNENTILFWVRNSDKMQHRVVIQSRIKEMLGKEGILEILSVFAYLDVHYFEQQLKSESEIENFKQEHKRRLTVTGIGQSIGYKEFYDFYFHFRTNLLHNESQNSSFQQLIELFKNRQHNYLTIYSTLQKNYDLLSQSSLIDYKLLESAQQELIKDTWAYCKRQITWIRNRIFQKDDLLIKRFYILDLAQKERKYSLNDDSNQNFQSFSKNFDKKDLMQRFNQKVYQKAIQIIDEIEKNGFQSAYEKFQTYEDEFKQVKQENKLENWKKYTCKECEQQLNGPNEWDEHLKSKKHLKRLKYLDKRDEIEKWIESRKKKPTEAKEKKQNEKNNDL